MSDFFSLYLGQRLLYSVGIAVLIAVSVGGGLWWAKQKHPHSPPIVHSLAPTVTQLERIGELAATRVHVTDVLSAEGEGYRGSWLIHGDALLSCDVSRAKLLQVNPATKTATLRLPALRVISPRVDLEKTKTWSVEKTTWLPWRWGNQGLLRDSAMVHAQHLVADAAGGERYLAPARTQAELLIRQMYEFVDWKISVEWE